MNTKQTKEKFITDVSIKIGRFIQSEIDSLKQDDSKWKEHYEDVMSHLKSEIENTKDIILDYKEENFTINRIEMEGYLRGMTTMYNQFKDWEQYVEDKED